MAGHSHIVLFGYRYDFLEEICDALPVVFGSNPAGFSHRQIFPVVLKLESRIGNAASSLGLLVSPYWYHGPVIRYYLDPHLPGFLDIPHDAVKLAVSFRPFSQLDIIGIHSYSFEINPVLITVVFHHLQLIGIPAAVLRTFSQLYGEMLHTIAQVELQILL